MKAKTKTWLKILALLATALVVVLVIATSCVLSRPAFGAAVEGERLERVKASPQHNGDHFANTPPPPAYDFGILWEEMMGDQVRVPPAPFPVERPELSRTPEPGLRAYWFGHATVLLELDGLRVMTDPMLSEFGFPVRAVAPRRNNPPPLGMDELPPIDVVVISHDHFDHLDMATIQALAAAGAHIFAGLGVGAHLERWEVPAEQIHELDWWQSESVKGIRVHCTPARHYSGRNLSTNPTLWASWVIEGPEHRVFHSGDSGYAEHFREIGDKHGPIDLALIKIGDYGEAAAWESIHMTPEDAVRAHVELGAKTMLAIHWGTFELSYHDWDEPVERAVAAANARSVQLIVPKLGERIVLGVPYEQQRWWKLVGD